MNKLNLLLLASILSIQTPVINQAYASNTSAIEQEAEIQEDTQNNLAAVDFQNMNEMNFADVPLNTLRDAKKKLEARPGSHMGLSFFKDKKGHIIASIAEHKPGKKPQHRVGFVYADNKVTQIQTNNKKYGKSITAFDKHFKSGTTVIKLDALNKHITSHINSKKAEARRQEDVTKEKDWYDSFWIKGTSHAKKQEKAAGNEAAMPTAEQKEAWEKRKAEREETRKETQKKFEQENIGSQKAASDYDKDKKEFSWPWEKDEAERKTAQNKEQEIAKIDKENKAIIDAKKAKAEADFNKAKNNYKKSGGDRELQAPTVNLSPNALQKNQELQTTQKKIIDSLETELTKAKERLQSQKDNPITADDRTFGSISAFDHLQKRALQKIESEIGDLETKIKNEKQILEDVKTAAQPTQTGTKPAAAPNTNLDPQKPEETQAGYFERAKDGLSAFGDAITNYGNKAIEWATKTSKTEPSSSTENPNKINKLTPDQNKLESTTGTSTITSDSHISKPVKTKVTPPKASGLLDRWFDSKPKTRQEKVTQIQERNRSKAHQDKKFAASKTQKNTSITQEWDETMKKGKEEISAVVSDANSALSK